MKVKLTMAQELGMATMSSGTKVSPSSVQVGAPVIAAAIPVAVATQGGNHQKQNTPYILTGAQIIGINTLRNHAILLIVSSILSNVTPMIIFVPSLDLLLSLVTASITIHWTHMHNVNDITKHNFDRCCGFRSIYGLAIGTAVVNGVFGFIRFWVYIETGAWFLGPGVGTYYVFIFMPSISSLIATVSAAFICSGASPNSTLASFTNYDQVLGVHPTPESPPPICISPQKSRRICYCVLVFFLLSIMLFAYMGFGKSQANYERDYYYGDDYDYYYNKDYYGYKDYYDYDYNNDGYRRL